MKKEGKSNKRSDEVGLAPADTRDLLVEISNMLLRHHDIKLPKDRVRYFVNEKNLEFHDKNLLAELVHRVTNLGETAETVLAEIATRPRRRRALAAKRAE